MTILEHPIYRHATAGMTVVLYGFFGWIIVWITGRYIAPVVTMSAIDAATAAVLAFALVLQVIGGLDSIATTNKYWMHRESENQEKYRKPPLIAKIVWRDCGEYWMHRKWLSAYERIWFPLFGIYHSPDVNLFRIRMIQRHVPLFLLSGTGIARFILGQPIIPLTGG